MLRTPEQEELIRLGKENKKLLMENDILKHAALTKELKFLDNSKCDKGKCPQIWSISIV